jgi:hypothetical protein
VGIVDGVGVEIEVLGEPEGLLIPARIAARSIPPLGPVAGALSVSVATKRQCTKAKTYPFALGFAAAAWIPSSFWISGGNDPGATGGEVGPVVVYAKSECVRKVSKNGRTTRCVAVVGWDMCEDDGFAIASTKEKHGLSCVHL